MKNNKIKWYRRLYLGEKAKGKKTLVLKKLSDGEIHPKLYLVVLPSNDSNLLDILPQPVLLQEHYRNMELYAVGVSVGKREAMELAGRIVMDAYMATGRTDVKAYLGDDFLDEPGLESEEENLYKEW